MIFSYLYKHLRCLLPLLAALLLNGCRTGCRTGSSGPEAACLIRMDRAEELRGQAPLNVDGFVKLQTTDEAVVGRIAKVVSCGERLYILTEVPQNDVFVFSDDGTFLYKLQKGRADNELVYPTDISVDEASGRLLVLDLYRSVKFYAPDGRYEAKVAFDQPQGYVESCGPHRAVLYSMNMSGRKEHDGYFLDRTNRLRGIYRSAYEGEGYRLPGVLTKFAPDSVLLCPLFSDTVYLCTAGGELQPRFIMECGGRSANDRERIRSLGSLAEYIDGTRAQRRYSGPEAVFYAHPRFFFHYGQPGKWAVYDAGLDETTLYSRMFDDLPACYGKAGQDGRRAIYAYDIAHLLGYFERHPPQTDMGRRIAAVCTDEEENPILVFATM